MDAFRDRHIEKLTLAFATQTGKSEALMNMLLYAIAQDPGPVLFVYPTDELAKSISKNRIMPMIRLCDVLFDKWIEDSSEILELQFLGIYVALVGANSPSKLASRPVRYLFFDETDKFPLYTGKEGKPTELAGERTKNFHNSKQIEASSPTLANGHIWESFKHAEVSKRYFVPCPHCGEMQTFKLSGVKWPEELNEGFLREERAERVLHSSWYECERCGRRIYDMDKQRMLLAGEWRPVEFTNEGLIVPSTRRLSRPSTVAYNLSSLYSPWVTFGQVAQKFLKTKDEKGLFMNFVNGWLGEPWETTATKLRSDAVMKLQLDYERGTVPEGAQLLTCGIDVQENCFWYEVRAWGANLTSWLVDYGCCETFGQIDVVIDREYPTPDGKTTLIFAAFMDSGYRTEEVYHYCSMRIGVVYPSKGSSQRMPRAPYVESRLDKLEPPLQLFVIDTHYYKNFIAGRIEREKGTPGSWNIFRDCHREYAEQICSEQLVEELDKQGRKHQTWKPVADHAPNHLLDASVYATAAAERAGLRMLKES